MVEAARAVSWRCWCRRRGGVGGGAGACAGGGGAVGGLRADGGGVGGGAGAVPAARGDHEGVLRALEPVVGLAEREGVDEPGFWPWQDLYADALVSAGRLGEAEAFLVPHEELAAAGGRGSTMARLARVRGRLEAARGALPAAEAAFRRALAERWSPCRCRSSARCWSCAYGQVLRRAGRRRAAAERLSAARERFAGLRARPYLERCERELAALGWRRRSGVFRPVPTDRAGVGGGSGWWRWA